MQNIIDYTVNSI